jgi:phosphoadenosine phosphosulfate reductase
MGRPSFATGHGGTDCGATKVSAVTTSSHADIELDRVNAQLADASAEQAIQWAVEQFGDQLVMTSSFGAQSAVMLHLATRAAPDIPVIFIDTGYLFPETYRFADELTRRLGLNLKVYQSNISPARMEALHGPLWEKGLEGMNRYDQLRKVEPLQHALADLGASAWLAGLRKQQTNHRSNLRKLEKQAGIFKLHPILDWSTRQVHEYLKAHDLPYHPLYEQGYMSIGDTHSTRPITDAEHERAGRFRGLKQECGLHLPGSAEEDQSRESSNL